MSGQIAAGLAALWGVRVLTSCLPPAAYGELALSQTGVMFVQQLISGPLGGAVGRFYPIAAQAGQADAFFASSSELTRKAVILIAGIGVLAAAVACAGFSTNVAALAALTFLVAILATGNSVLDSIQNAARQRIVVAWHQAIGQFARFGFAALLIYLTVQSSVVASAGYVLAAALVLGSQQLFFRRLRRAGGFNPRHCCTPPDFSRQMVAYAAPFSVWAVFTWAQMASERWALEFFSSTVDVGLYQVLYQLGYYPVAFIGAASAQLVGPILFWKMGTGTNERDRAQTFLLARRTSLLALGLSLSAAAIAWRFGAAAFDLVVSSEYHSGARLLWVPVVSAGLFHSAQLASYTLMAANRPSALIAPKVVTAAVGVLLNLYGARTFGVLGVLGANCCFSALYFVWIVGLCRRTACHVD